VIFFQRMLTYECRVARPEDAGCSVYVPYVLGLGSQEQVDEIWEGDRGHRARRPASLQPGCASSRCGRGGGGDPFRGERAGQGGLWSVGSEAGELLEGMSEMLGVGIERAGYVKNEASMPYPTHFHPPSAKELDAWQRLVGGHERRFAMALAGGSGRATEKLRSTLFWQCGESPSCSWLVDCRRPRGRVRRPRSLGDDRVSRLCLLYASAGDTCTRRAVLDSMLVAGCIPVVVGESARRAQQSHWDLPQDRSYYVFHLPRKLFKKPPAMGGAPEDRAGGGGRA